MPRSVTHRYSDALDRIWLGTAERIGLRVRRAGDAYATTDGAGTLLLGEAASLDADDSLGQMILHELCHSLVEGESSFGRRDWGLDNETVVDAVREHACLRVQAVLLGRHGLLRAFAPTTDYRAFYDALGPDPLQPRGEPSVVLAVLGVRRAAMPPWAPHLDAALAATRVVAGLARRFAPAAPSADLPDLLALAEDPPAPHPTGLPPATSVGTRGTCGTCAWRVESRRGSRCRQAGQRVELGWPACERWEPALDCRECGACCRAAYDAVVVGSREAVTRRHPALVERRGPYLEIRRAGDRCAALDGGAWRSAAPAADSAPRIEPFTCTIYADRPRSCRDFEQGGEHCLTARRRVGMSL